MSPLYNPSYTKGLAVTRLRIDSDGVVIEAEGYDGIYRKWTYRYNGKYLAPEWNYE